MKIEKNIPIPLAKNTDTIYPLAEMEIGDSILVTDEPKKARARVQNFKRYHGWEFVTRMTSNGLRIWRTA